MDVVYTSEVTAHGAILRMSGLMQGAEAQKMPVEVSTDDQIPIS